MTDELMALLAKATAGSWHVCQCVQLEGDTLFQIEARVEPDMLQCVSTDIASEDDAAAIVAAVNFCRTELPALVAERDALREALESPRNTREAPEVAAMRYIELLRADEGDTVVIGCDNPEAETVSVQTAIDCNGWWTYFKDRRFTGESVLQCLAKAVSARAALESPKL